VKGWRTIHGCGCWQQVVAFHKCPPHVGEGEASDGACDVDAGGHSLADIDAMFGPFRGRRPLVALRSNDPRQRTRFLDPGAVVGCEETMRHEKVGTLIHLAGGDETFCAGWTPEAVMKELGLTVPAASDNQPKEKP
jgi:hypothetical protein